jgi:hypothetical protein
MLFVFVVFYLVLSYLVRRSLFTFQFECHFELFSSFCLLLYLLNTRTVCPHTSLGQAWHRHTVLFTPVWCGTQPPVMRSARISTFQQPILCHSFSTCRHQRRDQEFFTSYLGVSLRKYSAHKSSGGHAHPFWEPTFARWHRSYPKGRPGLHSNVTILRGQGPTRPDSREQPLALANSVVILS